GPVHCYPGAAFAVASTQVGGVDERESAGRDEPRHERILEAIEGRVEGAFRGREVRRLRVAGHVHVSGPVDGDGVAIVEAAASAQEGGVEERGAAGGAELGHESIGDDEELADVA